MVGPVAKREAVAHLRNVLQMSERLHLVADRKMIRYRSPRSPDIELRRRQFGYRRLYILLRE